MGTVTVLRPHLAFDREETLLSFANRLALMHTGREMDQLLRDLGSGSRTSSRVALRRWPPSPLLSALPPTCS